jgi:predicted dehydrogenase
MLDLAIIGSGQISDRFLQQAQRRTDVRLVATCAKRLQSAEAKARHYGIGRWYDNYLEMLDAVRPDAVVIATPNSLHAAPAIAALERGMHVLCEKPMATSLAECHAMVAAAAQSAAFLMCLPFEGGRVVGAALEYLNEATLGKFTGAEAVILIPGHPRDNWYYARSISGGALLDCLVYPVSRLISLLGPARSVAGMMNTLIPKRLVGDGKSVDSDIDDNDTLIIEWETGQQAVVRTLWGSSFTRNDATIYGRHGTLWLSRDQIVVHSPRAPVPGAELVAWQNIDHCYRVQSPDEGHDESIVDHFVESIKSGIEPRSSGTLQLHVHEILFKGRVAAQTGYVQQLETRFIPWRPRDAGFFDTRGYYI